MKRITLYCTVLIAAQLSSVQAAVIRVPDASRHDRYTSASFPSAPVESATFFKASYDWSGVGWNKTNTRMGVTMISDIHFIAATHFNPGVFDDKGNADPSDDTGIVSFLGGDGSVYDYNVSTLTTLTTNYTNMGVPTSSNSDIVIGTLASAVNPTITNYSLLSTSGGLSDYLGVDLLHYGQNGRVGTGQIDSFTLANVSGRITATYRSDFVADDSAPSATDDDLRFQGGDSSSPSFYEKNGELVLSGIHSAIASEEVSPGVFNQIFDGHYINFDAFAYYYQSEITGLLAADSRSASFSTVIPIPEPSVSFLTLFTAGLSLFRRKRS